MSAPDQLQDRLTPTDCSRSTTSALVEEIRAVVGTVQLLLRRQWRACSCSCTCTWNFTKIMEKSDIFVLRRGHVKQQWHHAVRPSR